MYLIWIRLDLNIFLNERIHALKVYSTSLMSAGDAWSTFLTFSQTIRGIAVINATL